MTDDARESESEWVERQARRLGIEHQWSYETWRAQLAAISHLPDRDQLMESCATAHIAPAWLMDALTAEPSASQLERGQQ